MPGSGDGSQRCPDASEDEEEEVEEVEEQQVERCPICLGVLPGSGLAMPDSCTHLFCLECLLTWAESQTVPSCPVDRQPFLNVYMWDHPQGCVQVPVRKRASQPDSERCLCRSPEPSPCLKSKQGRRVRRHSDESDAKSKGLVRKCSDEDPASMNRKKVRGTRCPVWAPAPLAPIQGSLSQDLTDPLWVTEELARGPEGGQCKRQLQDCPWLGSAAPIPASGPTSAFVSRQRFPASNWNQCPFQSPPVTFDFSFAPSFGPGRTPAPSPGHFVFQGRVCAVTCPKGGDKRGGRASGSKAPPKQAAPSRRSGRNSRSQEEAPLSDPGSSPPSPPRPADSDSSSSGAPPPPGRTAQGPGKRKARKAPNRKTGKKGKGPGKGKASAPVLSSPSASEEEEEEEKEDGGGDHHQEEEEEEEKEGGAAEGSSPPRPAVYSDSDAEGSPETRPLPSPGSPDLLSHPLETPDETEEAPSPPEEKQEEPEEMEIKDNEDEEVEGESHSLPASSPPHSPGDVFSKDDQEKEEEEEEEEVPVCSPGSEGAYSPQGERNARLPSGSPGGSPGSPPSPGSDSDGQDQTDAAAADVKRDTPTDEDPKAARDPSPGTETAGPAGGAPGDKTPEDAPSDDDTNVVPMDCSPPGSQPAADDPKKGSASPGDAAAERSRERSRDRERSQEKKNGRQRRTRFHSPSSTWAGKAEGRQDPSSRRSRSPPPAADGSPPSRRSSRPRSRERERERERDPPRRDRSRERKRRRSRSRSRSRSKSRSRSRSRSRTRAHRRGSSPDRPASRERSPPRGERGRGTAWRGSRGGDSWRGQGGGGGGNSENGSAADASPERPPRSRDPDWVAEQRGGAAPAAPWEGGSGWRGGASERGRGGGGGQGGCNRSSSGQQGDSWGGRKNFPGAGNGSGGDAYSRFNENRGGGGGWRKDMGDRGDSMLDRSGWSSESSWAVRKTLPADVQDYYSRRGGRGGGGGAGGGGWNRTDEEPADPFKSDAAPQAGVPGNAPGGNPPLLPLPLPHPPQTGLLHNPYTAGGQRGAPPISLQPAAPYAMAPQVPVHMHSAVPHFQAPGAHGLPPPPPPPPPMHHGGLTAAAAQPDGHGAQMSAGPLAFGNPPQTVTQTKVGGPPPPVQTHPLPTSTTLPGQPSKARGTGDGSQKEKKQQIQERAVNAVKNAIKPYYQKKEITKDEYKEIVRKAVEKVCHSRSGEVNSSKVANLVKAYVDKYKHARKK
ncbi:protein SCAF11 isoform X1 [Gadus morhua]|uniref:protein SCAF11 isoform X1 n=1 Tax=Gadus morhua TaxID=8049 RepID=UPI0011B8333B|nr:protein SCAF11 isoform X1 [Gadus morhua]